jgi:tetratricopeptide (TPR) repeat protein
MTLVVVIGVVGLVAAVGNPFTWASHQLRSTGEVANGSKHLGSLETNNRTVWWGEAWRVFRAHPAGGTGALTFEIARKRVREDAQNVVEPHSLPLQLLSDSGLPGLALGLLVAIGLGVGIRRAVGRLDPGERAAAVALLGLPLAFGLHALVDYDLDFLAITVPTMIVSAALLAAGRPAALARSRGLVAAAAILAGLAAVWVLAAPALSTRAVDRAYSQSDAGDVDAAAASARRAQSLNPLSPDPLYARAVIASQAGDDKAAEAFYEQATRLQPENPETWWALGLFRQLELRNQCSAYFAFNAAFTLDPKSSLFNAGGPLDQARAAVNDAAHPACGR